jgi:hypothetical protein
MSTIRHPVQHHLWWYATAAVLAGAVLALMILALTPTGSAPTVQTDTGVTTTYPHYRLPACHAGRPSPSIELPGCANLAR